MVCRRGGYTMVVIPLTVQRWYIVKNFAIPADYRKPLWV